jgi:sugar/nucleoside kinase (ribokinase family)
MEPHIDFLAIGDIVTDAFILLKEAKVTCDKHGENCMLSMRFGDKLPYEQVDIVRAVGNSPNASVSAAHLGDDENGKECLASLVSDKVLTKYVRVHAGRQTNYHYVLRFGAERTILVKHHDYPYQFPNVQPPPKWLYLSSLAECTLPYHMEIADYLERNPSVKLAFQPGTFQMSLGEEKLARIYKRTDVFFCNKEEAQRILSTTKSDIKKLLTMIAELGPKIAVITDGPKGAYAYDSVSGHAWHMPMYPDPKPPVSRTGAGDAFSSTFISALCLNKTIAEALAWGPINSMAVVQQIGAQKGLLSRAQLEEYLANAPKDYIATQIM